MQSFVSNHVVCMQNVAAGVGQAPINICADNVLLQLSRIRPGRVASLSAVDGCTAVFKEQHGQVCRPCHCLLGGAGAH